MLEISKRYDIRDAGMGTKTKLISLPDEVFKELEKDADRCLRSSMRHIEAILTAYLGMGDVGLRDMEPVRAAVKGSAKKGAGAGRIASVPVVKGNQNDAERERAERDDDSVSEGSGRRTVRRGKGR